MAALAAAPPQPDDSQQLVEEALGRALDAGKTGPELLSALHAAAPQPHVHRPLRLREAAPLRRSRAGADARSGSFAHWRSSAGRSLQWRHLWRPRRFRPKTSNTPQWYPGAGTLV